MSEERVVETASGIPRRLTKDDMAKMSRDDLRKHMASVLDRSLVNDRLWVDLPPDTHGEWVFNDPLELARYEALGFEIDTQYANKRSLHNLGDGSSIVGDVIFMTCPMIVKEVIDEQRKLQYDRINGKGKKVNKQKEEADTVKQIESPGYIKPTESSDASVVSGAEIAAAIGAQTT
jgi:hypothetical protein